VSAAGGGGRGHGPTRISAKAEKRVRKRIDREVNRVLMGRLERDARRICARFGLRYRALEAERANVKRRYGICYSDGTIKIRLRHANTGRPLKYSSLVNTLCHELAHLRHFNHGEVFQQFYDRLLEWSRSQGLYRPGRARRAPADSLEAQPRAERGPPAAAPVLAARPEYTAPQQLRLFG
jgi:hypothetical protein